MNASRRVCAVVACLLVGVAAGPAAVAASHDHGYTDFETTPGDRTPGADGVDYRLAVEVTDEFDGHESVEQPERVLFAVDGTALEPCAEGGEPFAEFPHSLYVERADGSRAPLVVDGVVWDDDAALFGLSDDDQPAIGVGDTLVLELEGCVDGPDDRGWYRALVNAEGEAPDGETTRIDAFSHYFGVCEGCESDGDAREELGAPPSESDATPTPTTAPTASPTPTTMPTAIPTSTATPTATRTATPPPTATRSPSPTDPAVGATERSATETGTTPSVGDGAGFAPLAALVALVVASALRRRR